MKTWEEREERREAVSCLSENVQCLARDRSLSAAFREEQLRVPEAEDCLAASSYANVVSFRCSSVSSTFLPGLSLCT